MSGAAHRGHKIVDSLDMHGSVTLNRKAKIYKILEHLKLICLVNGREVV